MSGLPGHPLPAGDLRSRHSRATSPWVRRVQPPARRTGGWARRYPQPRCGTAMGHACGAGLLRFDVAVTVLPRTRPSASERRSRTSPGDGRSVRVRHGKAAAAADVYRMKVAGLHERIDGRSTDAEGRRFFPESEQQGIASQHILEGLRVSNFVSSAVFVTPTGVGARSGADDGVRSSVDDGGATSGPPSVPLR